MKFDDQCKVIIDTMDESEAKAFIKFLASEIFRHMRDIDDARKLVKTVEEKFRLKGE